MERKTYLRYYQFIRSSLKKSRPGCLINVVLLTIGFYAIPALNGVRDPNIATVIKAFLLAAVVLIAILSILDMVDPSHKLTLYEVEISGKASYFLVDHESFTEIDENLLDVFRGKLSKLTIAYRTVSEEEWLEIREGKLAG